MNIDSAFGLAMLVFLVGALVGAGIVLEKLQPPSLKKHPKDSAVKSAGKLLLRCLLIVIFGFALFFALVFLG
jgi:hypothetical protein